VVRDNKIVAIGPRGKVTIPAGAKVIDVLGKTIVPDWSNPRPHLGVLGHSSSLRCPSSSPSWAYGVTTQRDPQTSSEDVLTYRDLVETGEILGPRIYTTGTGSFPTT